MQKGLLELRTCGDQSCKALHENTKLRLAVSSAFEGCQGPECIYAVVIASKGIL